jgi:hypothetical protein
VTGFLWALLAAAAGALGVRVAVALALDWGPVAVASVGGAGVAMTAVGAWMSVRRQRSGSIETSESTELWAELRSYSSTLRSDLLAEREHAAALRERVAILEAGRREDRERIADLEDTERQARRRIEALETEVERLRSIAG